MTYLEAGPGYFQPRRGLCLTQARLLFSSKAAETRDARPFFSLPIPRRPFPSPRGSLSCTQTEREARVPFRHVRVPLAGLCLKVSPESRLWACDQSSFSTPCGAYSSTATGRWVNSEFLEGA